MILRALAIPLLLSWILTGIAAGDVLEIPLTLRPIGHYVGATRVDGFAFPFQPDEINRIELQVTGYYRDPRYDCWGNGHWWSVTAPGSIVLTLGDDLSLGAAPAIRVVHYFPPTDGATVWFDIDVVLLTGNTTAGPFLDDRESECGLQTNQEGYFDVGGFTCLPREEFGTLMTAVLKITHGELVVGRTRTWSSVKRLYR